MRNVTEWDYQTFQKAADDLCTIGAAEEFVRTISDVIPVRHACFRYWRLWTPGAEPALEIANYPRRTPPELSELRELRRSSMDRCAFERILPINWLEEIEKSTDLGQLLLNATQYGPLTTGFTIIVRGPGGQGGLFVCDCERAPETWSAEFERSKGAIQLIAQSLYLALERVVEAPREILTPREKECLQLCARGMTVKQIARRLELSDQTVTFYLGRVRMKLGVSNTTEAVAKAVKGGIL